MNFKTMDHPGQDEIDKFFNEELKKDAKAKKNNRKSKRLN
jgi:hypothetical protein